jgi:hypothetical protein
LLTECPYSKAIYSLLDINCDSVSEVLGVNLNRNALEIRADILNYIVFRQKMIPPSILVRTTLEKYANGIVNRDMLIRTAQALLDRLVD